MRGKFLGFLFLLASVAVLSLGQSGPADAGLFGFGLFSQSSCGGGGAGLQYGSYSSCSGGGGAGLQYGSYSSCGGGSVGGGLQYAPTTYYVAPQSYYAPASYYPSSMGGCPGGVCPPASGGLTYSPTYYRSAPVQMATVRRPVVVRPVVSVPPGIRLAPGERYVAGSLRAVTPAARNVASLDRTPDRVEESTKPVHVATTAGIPLPEGYVLHMLTQRGCAPCDRSKARAGAMGLMVNVVQSEEHPEIVERLWRNSGLELGFPAWVMTYQGRPVAWGRGEKSEVGLRKMAAYRVPGESSDAAIVADTENRKLDRIEELLTVLVDESRATRRAIEGVSTAATAANTFDLVPAK